MFVAVMIISLTSKKIFSYDDSLDVIYEHVMHNEMLVQFN